ncbi:50S ribosomal protein L29 [candidate division KD3-62 bacterium DG_56]|uniref:Large ribosomal subunit protein uL29 n=1 Tax=candidate division KD3-62 bacterium DG_56 TaxID=1704032 RepID=A0A0S7XR59_9BACT|nr:MAG: 50S ribosomal protein L29 [candidate division KD3-62 bacterium DG_56]
MAKASALREHSDQELQQQLRHLRDELFRLRFQRATKQLDKEDRLRQVRKDIARVLTILHERGVGREQE